METVVTRLVLCDVSAHGNVISCSASLSPFLAILQCEIMCTHVYAFVHVFCPEKIGREKATRAPVSQAELKSVCSVFGGDAKRVQVGGVESEGARSS